MVVIIFWEVRVRVKWFVLLWMIVGGIFELIRFLVRLKRFRVFFKIFEGVGLLWVGGDCRVV